MNRPRRLANPTKNNGRVLSQPAAFPFVYRHFPLMPATPGSVMSVLFRMSILQLTTRSLT